MSRPQRYSSQDVRTTLGPEDMKRFHDTAVLRGVKYVNLAREAIVFYLDHQDRQEEIVRENIYSRSVKQSTNRICAMLSKVAVDTRAIYAFLADLEGDPQRMMQCRAAAIKQISKVLTDGEREVAEGMSKIVSVNASAGADESSDAHHRQA